MYQSNLVFGIVSKSVYLLTCLHFEISSVLLLRILSPLNNAISSFSFRQRLLVSDERLKREHFLRMLHFVWGTEFLRFIFLNSFESAVSFLYAAKLKDFLRLLYFFLNVVYKYARHSFVHYMWWWLYIQYFQLVAIFSASCGFVWVCVVVWWTLCIMCSIF